MQARGSKWGNPPSFRAFVHMKNDYMDLQLCVFPYKGFLCFFCFVFLSKPSTLFSFVKYYIIVSNCFEFYYISIYSNIIAKLNALWGGCAITIPSFLCLPILFYLLGLYVPGPKGKTKFLLDLEVLGGRGWVLDFKGRGPR
jgi:hypothetical protein